MQNITSAHKLITPNRFDLGAKILFLERLKQGYGLSNSIYDKHIQCITENKLFEPDNSHKFGLESYRREFTNLYSNIKDVGFDNSKPVPLSLGGSLYNGAHRTSICIVLNKKIAVQTENVEDHHYDYRYFREQGMTSLQCDAMFSAMARYNKNIMCAVYWPKSKATNRDIESQLKNIFYIRELDIHPDNRDVFVSHVYKNEPWLGSLEDGYPGAALKSENCFSGSYKIRLVFFTPDDQTNLIRLKEKIRTVYGIGKSSVHITDSHSETLEICNTFLNKHTLHLLKHGKPLARISLRKTLANLIEYQNSDNFIVAGSTTLSLYDLRDALDTDVLPINPGVEDSLAQINVSCYDRHELAHFPKPTENYFFDSSLTIYLFGLRFIPLKTIRQIKKSRNEVKDLQDIQLIDALLNQRGLIQRIEIFTARFKQNTRKVKRFVKAVLVRLKIFNLVYPLYIFLSRRR